MIEAREDWTEQQRPRDYMRECAIAALTRIKICEEQLNAHPTTSEQPATRM